MFLIQTFPPVQISPKPEEKRFKANTIQIFLKPNHLASKPSFKKFRTHETIFHQERSTPMACGDSPLMMSKCQDNLPPLFIQERSTSVGRGGLSPDHHLSPTNDQLAVGGCLGKL